MGEQEFRATVSEKIDTWPRFGSKVALWLGSHVFGDAWLDSPAAVAARKILWDEPRELQQAAALPSRVDSSLPSMFDPPQHSVFLLPASEAMAAVCLFGEWLYATPLGQDVGDRPPAWIMDPHARTFRQTDWDGLLSDAVRRM